ncbi:hypothetical protein CEXT_167871 [Caerostris extrusa]|uniref:Uncharacterized protein n=1 Tax=Caerostris extrusa TaxID=172846 RepID=A0AAV4MZQ1_CAEEX|nr:hypothetical protein CEXT_167871 [Caerostris extrusa]
MLVFNSNYESCVLTQHSCRHVAQQKQRLLGVAKTTCQALAAVANSASTGPVRHMASCEIPATCYPAGIGWQRRPVDSVGLTRGSDRNFSHFPVTPHPFLSHRPAKYSRFVSSFTFSRVSSVHMTGVSLNSV